MTKPDWRHIATWDATIRGCWQLTFWPEICRWARAHGGTSETWRYEIWYLDCGIARILDYKLNAQGRRYIDPGQGEVAQAPARVLPLAELPPEDLCVNADTWPTDHRARTAPALWSGHDMALYAQALDLPGQPPGFPGSVVALPGTLEIIPLQAKANLGRRGA